MQVGGAVCVGLFLFFVACSSLSLDAPIPSSALNFKVELIKLQRISVLLFFAV